MGETDTRNEANYVYCNPRRLGRELTAIRRRPDGFQGGAYASMNDNEKKVW